MDYKVFLEHLKEGFDSDVIVLCGTENYLINRALDEIINKFSGDFPEFNTTVFGEETEPDTVISTCEQLPFMADKRLVIIKNPPELQKTSAGSDQYIKYLSDPSEQTLLVMLLNSKLDMRLQLSKELNKKKAVISFETPDNLMLNKWIIKQLLQLGKKIAPQNADVIILRTGADMLAIENELKKLAAAAGESDAITAELIDELIKPVSQENIFKLIDHILEKNPNKMFALLNELTAEGEKPAGIISLLLSTFRNVLQIKLAEGTKPNVTLPDFVIRKYQRQLRGVSTDTVKDVFRIILKAEDDFKSGQIQPDSALYNALSKIVKELQK